MSFWPGTGASALRFFEPFAAVFCACIAGGAAFATPEGPAAAGDLRTAQPHALAHEAASLSQRATAQHHEQQQCHMCNVIMRRAALLFGRSALAWEEAYE